MSPRSLAAATILALSLAGCVTNGNDFPSDVKWIQDGKTKQPDVKRLLGEPYSVGNSGGKPTWTYGFYRYKLIGKSLQKELKFYWNPDGTVNSFSFNSSFPEDTGAPSGSNDRSVVP
jgi:outer membrane protein assembly factor BamE (lipoprotein component of BamABCDE complex)